MTLCSEFDIPDNLLGKLAEKIIIRHNEHVVDAILFNIMLSNEDFSASGQ